MGRLLNDDMVLEGILDGVRHSKPSAESRTTAGNTRCMMHSYTCQVDLHATLFSFGAVPWRSTRFQVGWPLQYNG